MIPATAARLFVSIILYCSACRFNLSCKYDKGWKIAFYCLQVYFVDIDVNEGKRAQKELEDEFVHGMATFLELNVTDKEKFEGTN